MDGHDRVEVTVVYGGIGRSITHPIERGVAPLVVFDEIAQELIALFDATRKAPPADTSWLEVES